MDAFENPIEASGMSSALTPPASAWSLLPPQIDWQARLTATSADEQAVSTEALGPLKSKRYEIRFEAIDSVLPLLVCTSIARSPDIWIDPYSFEAIPTKQPVFEPRRVSGRVPASSIASHEHSSNQRCCGSMRRASRGEMPKNCGSNWSTPSMKPPHLVIIFFGTAGSGW